MKRFFNAEFAADTTYLKLVTDLTVTMAKLAGFSETVARDIALAVDEAVTNTIKHAYGFDRSKTIGLHVTITDRDLVIDVRHTGTPISKSEVRLPDMEEYMREYRKGGLGIVLMTRIMDHVSYGSTNGVHYCRLTRSRPES